MKRILIVEDQAEIRKLIRMTLEFEDFELFEAGDGGAGLLMVDKAMPDLVLLDVMMPGELDGFQVCQKIKSRPDLRHVKVVMLTARGQQNDLEAGTSAGADAYLTKPFSPLELIDTVIGFMHSGVAVV
jgi:two-component system, OmpR family, phosphate regulon response regulator PhoB